MIVSRIEWFGSDSFTYNTFIGGIGGTVTTDTLLAAKLSITDADITNFTIDANNNVKCYISVSYTINTSAFYADTSITYYLDYDGHCTSVNLNAFRDAYNLHMAYFPSMTTSGANVFFQAATDLTAMYFMSMTSLSPIGGAVTNNTCFTKCDVYNAYFNTATATNNGGSPDGDITDASATFTNITYVGSDVNSPSTVNDVALSGSAFGTYFTVSWSAPSSTNTIDGYVVVVDGVAVGWTTSTSFQITGLTVNTSYIVEVLCFDDKGNCSSLVDSAVTISTSATYVLPTANIVSYWPFNSDSLDQVGTNHGTDTSMSYVASGGVGNVADFTAGTTSKVTVADDNSLSFGNSTTDSAFSWIVAVKFNSTATSVQQFIRKGAASLRREYVLRKDAGAIEFRLLDQSSGGFIEATFNFTFSTGVWYLLIGTYDGSSSQNGINLYKDGVLLAATKTLSGSYTAMENSTDPLVFGNISDNTTQSLDGYEDEAVLVNKELTQLEIDEITANYLDGNPIT